MGKRIQDLTIEERRTAARCYCKPQHRERRYESDYYYCYNTTKFSKLCQKQKIFQKHTFQKKKITGEILCMPINDMQKNPVMYNKINDIKGVNEV